MKVISLTQPWASLMALDAKRFETRSWATAYHGPIAIHAAKGFPCDCQQFCTDPVVQSVLAKHGFPVWRSLPLGCIIAIRELIDCVPTAYLVDGPDWRFRAIPPGCPPGPQERYFGDYSPGRFAWITKDVQRLTAPIPAKGALGLWEFDDDKLAAALGDKAALLLKTANERRSR